MRVIKHRTWDGSVMEYDVAIGRHRNDARNTCIIIDYHGCYEYHEPPLVEMEFTGIPDKDYRDIFELDILKASGCCPEDEGLYVVKWNHDECGFFLYYSDGLWHCNLSVGEVDSLNLKVVGNICQNPKLGEFK